VESNARDEKNKSVGSELRVLAFIGSPSEGCVHRGTPFATLPHATRIMVGEKRSVKEKEHHSET
jgi:hypothetical protein